VTTTDALTEDEEIKSKAGPLEFLFYGNASARILDFLYTHKEFDYSETDIAKFAGVSIRTTFREIPKFKQLELIENTRRVGRAKMYRVHPKSSISKSLEQLVYDISTKKIDNPVQNYDLEQKKANLLDPLDPHNHQIRPDISPLNRETR
jgi:hypothetical protein